MTITLTPAEVVRLHDEIGDIPKHHVGQKLMELYRRLDNLVGIDWVAEELRKKGKTR